MSGHSADVVLDLLSRVQAKLHVDNGRVSGSLYAPHPTWTYVTFRGGKDETIADTLARALAELHRRMLTGMPRTTQTAPCAACGVTGLLRYLDGAKQWLCAECRRGLRSMSEERRRRQRREAQS